MRITASLTAITLRGFRSSHPFFLAFLITCIGKLLLLIHLAKKMPTFLKWIKPKRKILVILSFSIKKRDEDSLQQ